MLSLSIYSSFCQLLLCSFLAISHRERQTASILRHLLFLSCVNVKSFSVYLQIERCAQVTNYSSHGFFPSFFLLYIYSFCFVAHSHNEIEKRTRQFLRFFSTLSLWYWEIQIYTQNLNTKSEKYLCSFVVSIFLYVYLCSTIPFMCVFYYIYIYIYFTFAMWQRSFCVCI